MLTGGGIAFETVFYSETNFLIVSTFHCLMLGRKNVSLFFSYIVLPMTSG